ncbi:MAG: Lrp/AsnC ligand binding domain-containing protein [Acidilobaceae archaeon]
MSFVSTEAVILVNVDIGKEEIAFQKLLEIPEVKEAYIVYGIHDLIAVVKADGLEELRQVVVQKIRKIEGVRNTITCIVVKKEVKST